MRPMIVATTIFLLAASARAQPATTAPAASTTPPLTKSVTVDPGDSPLVRAAKRAVASRQRSGNRRVITVTATSNGAGRGRFAQATGPTDGPQLPAAPASSAPTPQRQRDTAAQQKAMTAQQGQVQQKLKQLDQEQARIGAELDEPYGGDIDEDEVDRRLNDIETQRRVLQAPPPPPPNR